MFRRRGCFPTVIIAFIFLYFAALGTHSRGFGKSDPLNSGREAAEPESSEAQTGDESRHSNSVPGDFEQGNSGFESGGGPGGQGRGDFRTDSPSVRTAADIPRPRWSADEPEYRVSKVVDGDTIRLSEGGKVRLLGVDTPETKDPRKPVQYFGREASTFTKREIDSREVRLTYDQTRKDRYGRLLAYVWRNPDDFFLNAELIAQGYGLAYTKFPFKYTNEFLELQRAAREEERGLWANPEDIGKPESEVSVK